MLEGDVQILENLFLPGNDLDQLVRHRLRVEVVEADPVEVQPAQLLQKVRQVEPAVPVRAVAGDVLGDDDELLHPPLRQLPCLGQHVLHGPAAVPSPELGDDAEGAPVVTPLGNAQVGIVGGGGEHPAELVHRGVDVVKAPGVVPGHHVLHRGDDVLVAAGSQDAVHLGQLCGNVLAVALGHAAADQDPFQLSLFFQLAHL